MRLVRLALVSLTPPSQTEISRCVIASADGIHVEITPVPSPVGLSASDATQLIAKATIGFSPEQDGERYIVIPDEPRRRCEQAIIRAADLFAVATRRQRHIISATPPLALVPDSDSERSLIATSIAIRADPPRSIPTFRSSINLTEVAPALSDRWDGVSLLAEAYSYRGLPSYRDLVRLFELAFSRSFMQLAKKLSQTLAPPMGYSVREIAKWQSLRHPLFHADLQQATEIAIEADARTVVLRMEQAAWDILLNKAEWHSWSSARRALWDPPAITTNEAGHGVLRQGSKPTLEFLLLDEFGVFPRAFPIQHTNLPADWWHRFVAEGGSVT